MIILKTTRHHEGQEIEIFVRYDKDTNTVDEIKAVNLKTHGHTYPIGNFVHGIDELLTAINAIIDNTDWREVYRELDSKQLVDNYWDSAPVVGLHPVMQKALSPFINPHP